MQHFKRLINAIDQSTARITASAFNHSKLDFCDSLLLDIPASHINRVQLILISATPRL